LVEASHADRRSARAGDLFLAPLEAAGAPARLFADATAFLRAAQRESFDLIALEWAASQVEVIEAVRAGLLARAPIFLIVGEAHAESAADGLYAGADDVLPATVPADLLAAKLAAAWRRTTPAPPPGRPWRAGPYEIDWQARTVARRGRQAGLTRKEFALLEALLSASGRPLSRSYLLERVWGPSRDHDTRTLDAHVYRLRNKLALRDEQALRLTPLYGYGYQLDVVDGF
jgi:DNA-binding response OmpR family regulator